MDCECLFEVLRCWRPRPQKRAGKGSVADVPGTGFGRRKLQRELDKQSPEEREEFFLDCGSEAHAGSPREV